MIRPRVVTCGVLAALLLASAASAKPRGRSAGKARAGRTATALTSEAGSGAGTQAASPAPAAPSGPSDEARARALARSAMDGSHNAADARRLLEQALSICEGDRCSDVMVASLRRDLAVCDADLGASDEQVVANLREGLRRDPSMTLEAHRRGERLTRLYHVAKRDGSADAAAAPPARSPARAPAEDLGATATAVPGGDVRPSPPERIRRLWLGVEGSLDIAFLSSAEDVCKLNGTEPMNDAGYFCTRSDGADYPDRNDPSQNDAIQVGQLDSVAGGPAVGNVRIKLRADWALDEHWLVGGRIGWVLNSYPGEAAPGLSVGAPFDLEARITYLHGRHPLSRPGTSQYVYVGAGLSETNAGVRVELVERSGQVRSATAWQIGGFFYASAGLGVRYALTPALGILAGPRFALAIGGQKLIPAIAPELALTVGF